MGAGNYGDEWDTTWNGLDFVAMAMADVDSGGSHDPHHVPWRLLPHTSTGRETPDCLHALLNPAPPCGPAKF
jgi:hypothetical protein